MKHIAAALLGAQIATKRALTGLAGVGVKALPAAPAAKVRGAGLKLSEAERLIHEATKDLAAGAGRDEQGARMRLVR